MLQSAQWPKKGIELSGNRVGIVGTRTCSVQIVQTIAPIVKELVRLITTLERLMARWAF